ncbi:MAG TPA: hypothetical protein VNT32_08560, partial [Thermoleophilaceae bacterium]|nr:hypothetical protein [Thermoleophilaceae bacterium]
VDAIFAAARYLKAAGYEKDIDRAIFAYNHADWYVDSVNLRAKLIAGVPAEVIGSLTGLTEGRFPVYAKARYASSGEPRDRRGIEIYTRRGAPVIAVNDGIVRRIGESERLGRYLVLEDNYGNRYTYGLLAEIEDAYPVPKHDGRDPRTEVRAERARRDPAPDGPASSGAQDAGTGDARHASEPDAAVKTRLFANPGRPRARRAGGAEQLLNADPRYTTYRARLARPFGLGRQDVRLKPLERGARVATGTILGRTGRPDPEAAPHVRFEIRPAGRRSPRIDPKPILDGWKLLEATAVYGASGRNVLHGEDASIGQILLLPKRQLERRVLSDDRIQIYECGRKDVRAGRVDRRVLATLSYLAESGLRPTVTSLICGHSYLTRSGNVSHHSSGSAVDIAAINGVPVLGHQESGGVTHQAVRRLALLQGRMAPDQVISLIDIGGPTLSLADHADHIHVGFRPQVREQPGDGGAYALLEPGVWHDLIERLGEIENPVVRVRPSDAAVPAHRTKRRATSGD